MTSFANKNFAILSPFKMAVDLRRQTTATLHTYPLHFTVIHEDETKLMYQICPYKADCRN